jgi:hypothetical protein
MGGNNDDRVELRDVVWAKVCKAVNGGHAVQTGDVARQLSVSYPNSGMSCREIEDEIIRMVGLAGGIAEIGNDTRAQAG